MVENAVKALLSVEFGAGFRLGLIAAVLGGLASLLWRAKAGQPLHVVGVMFVGAAAWAMKVAMDVPAEALLGLALLGIGGLIARSSESLFFGAAAAIPGAWFVVASLEVGDSSWISWFLLAAIAIGGVLAARTDQLISVPTVTPLLVALTIAGVYFAVPDTEEVLVLAGAITPLALLGWPLGLSKIGGSGCYATVGILAWTTAWGGMGRPAAIVGAVSCLGMFLLIPFFHWSRDKPALIVGLHLILVAAGSRLSGHQTDPKVATLLAVAALVVGYLAMQFANRAETKADRAQERI